MVLTTHEMNRLVSHSLKEGCYYKEGRYHSILNWKGNNINLGAFDSAIECNEVWVRAKKKRVNAQRQPAAKGYSEHLLADGTYSYPVKISYDGGTHAVGTYYTEEDARAAYLDAFYQVKAGTWKGL